MDCPHCCTLSICGLNAVVRSWPVYREPKLVSQWCFSSFRHSLFVIACCFHCSTVQLDCLFHAYHVIKVKLISWAIRVKFVFVAWIYTMCKVPVTSPSYPTTSVLMGLIHHLSNLLKKKLKIQLIKAILIYGELTTFKNILKESPLIIRNLIIEEWVNVISKWHLDWNFI